MSKSKIKHNVLKLTRVVFAALFFAGLTLLFLDFTNTLHPYLSWMAKLQLLPAILSVNVVVVIALLLLTFLFGRVYCSVICPMGVLQDIFSHVGSWRKKHRFSYHKPQNILRYIVLAVFVLLLVLGLQSIALLIAPYSAYGRIVNSLFAPIYALINNLFASMAGHYGSYAFYSADVWLRSVSALVVSAITFVGIGALAFFRGRLWCNTICPVGGLLSLVSRYSLFAISIDKDKCTNCRSCERNCKSECINIKEHSVDSSRCVDCMNCLENCKFGAIGYKLRSRAVKAVEPQSADAEVDASRRRFLTTTATIAASGALSAQHKTTDGGLAVIEQKRVPARSVQIKPAGAGSIKRFGEHCTACQLCVSACPGKVLRPSDDIKTLMQPEMSFERGYCAEDCTRCSEVCPAGAIEKINADERLVTQVGHAVWIRQNCVVITDGVSCGNCARHCPVHAIMMVDDGFGHEIPAVDESKCIGCGKCEYLCPSRPFSAIYVEGYEQHKTI
ncbi:MAG: 4Fe-4S binding protein [Paludibacteraceae bacterium]|nr:4Fe-4S binding protein [Paludibacteraceae bacterium]